MRNFTISFVLLFFLIPAFSQSIDQKELDSLEIVLQKTNKNEIGKIVKIGEYLIANTESEEKKYYLLGIIISAYAEKNDKNKSIEYLFRAKKIAENIGDVELTTKVYVTIASLYASLNLNDKAKIYLEQAWKQSKKLPVGKKKSSITAFLYNEQGTFFFNNKDYQQANDNFKRSLKEFSTTLKHDSGANTPFYYKSLLHNFGKSFLHLNQPDSAQAYLNKALRVKDTLYPNLKYNIYIDLSEVYAIHGEHRRAIDTLKVILSDKKFDIPQLKSLVYLNLSRNYKILDDMPNYSLYNEKYLELSPQVQGEDRDAINSMFDAEQHEYISESTKDWYLLVGFVVILGLGSAIAIYILQKKKKNDKEIYLSIIRNLENKKDIPLEPIAHNQESDSGISIPESVEQDILRKLIQFENAKKFTNQKLSIATMAVQFKTNTTYLSEIINREKGKNFNTYINELRINFICNEIHENPEYRNYKISYLAETCGFNSHSAFATVFKSVTGISPSAFLKQSMLTERQKAKNMV